MSLKTKFILFSALNGILILALTYPLLEERLFLFFFVEVFVLGMMIYAAYLGKQIFTPIKLLTQGIQAIKDQDFQVKYKETGNKETDKLITVYNRMSEQLRQERVKLREQDFFLQKLIEASPAGILVFSYDEEVISANPAALKILDMDEKELLDRPLGQFDHPLIKQLAQLPANSYRTIERNGIQKLKCHSSVFIHKGFEQRFITIEDMSHELLESEKKAYGKVIRMMSHEVNNSMGAVNSLLNSLKLFAPKDETREDFEEALEVAVDRNNSLRDFMRNFASVIRLPQAKFEPVKLEEFLQKTVALLQPQCQQQNIDLKLQLPEAPVSVQADETQLQQVMINVIKNATEAILEKQEKGTIEIILESEQLLIRNNGPAISQETAGKLFSPFFSTKTHGQGIGLTLCREILMNHHFPFRLFTAPDGWTSFEINFK